MKNYYILIVTAILYSGIVMAQELPESSSILCVCEKVNGYFMTEYADCTAESNVRQVPRPSHIWTRSVYYEGLMSLYGVMPREKYYEYAYNWADFHNWTFRKGPNNRNADDICAAQTYIDLYRLLPDEKHLFATRAHVEMLLNTAKCDDWTWIDAIQMHMPVLAKMGNVTKDVRCYNKMWQMYCYTRNKLGGGTFNEEEGLWWRDSDFVAPFSEINGRNCYWSRGNGWVAAALVRVLDEMPADGPHREDYVRDLKLMSEALLKCQREDGFWNVSLHCEENHGGKELTGTALFVYAMSWGIRNGILDRETYMPAVVKAWNALANECVRGDGSLAYVQGTGKRPSDGQPVTYDSRPDFEDYGTGCFLLAGVEVYKLALYAENDYKSY